MNAAMEIIFPIGITLLPMAVLVWAVYDVGEQLSLFKAFFKMCLGIAAVLLFCSDGPRGLSWVLIGAGLVTTLLGTADLVVLRGRQQRD